MLASGAVAAGGMSLGSDVALMVRAAASAGIEQPGDWRPCRVGPSPTDPQSKNGAQEQAPTTS